MALSSISDQELIELYRSRKTELSIAEDELHTAYTVYGGEYAERINIAEEYASFCQDNFNSVKNEMNRRGIEMIDDV